MTILEALKKITESIRDWAEAKFLNKNDAIPTVYIAGSDTVIWTGNEQAIDVGAPKPYYYISEATPVMDDLSNGMYINIIDDIPYDFFAEDIYIDDNGVIHAYQEEVIIVNTSSVGKSIESLDGDLVFPYAGIYIAEKFVEHILSFVIPGYTGFGARKVIDSNYMPGIIKLTSVTILADAWEGQTAPYSQTVVCNGITVNSKIDLQPAPEQIVEMYDAEIALMAANNDGVVTIYSFNDKPTTDMEMNVLITEVTVL